MFIKYIGKKFLRMLTVLIGVCIFTFSLVVFSPVDPISSYLGSSASMVSAEQYEQIVAYWGLNLSPLERFSNWFIKLLQGDFGQSLIYRKPVLDVIGERFSASLGLMIVAFISSGVLGFALGVLMGAFKDRLIDKSIKGICLVLASTPTFWLGMLLIMVFSVQLKWLPVGLAVPIGSLAEEVSIFDRIRHMLLPALTVSMGGIANIALHTREKIIEIFKSEYILFAKARGENLWDIIRRHGIRNALLPAITLQFASFGELFGGSLLAEQVFSYPGLGQTAVDAGLRGDLPLLMGIVIFLTLFVFLGNFVADILCYAMNPKLRQTGGIEP